MRTCSWRTTLIAAALATVTAWPPVRGHGAAQRHPRHPRNVAPLMSGFDEQFTRALMEYYMDILRGDPAKIATLCGSASER